MAKTVVQEALNGLIGDLRATHGDNLASVVLYGSAAAGDHVELRSDYNLLITLNRITPEDLRLAQAPMRECSGSVIRFRFISLPRNSQTPRRISNRVSSDG